MNRKLILIGIIFLISIILFSGCIEQNKDSEIDKNNKIIDDEIFDPFYSKKVIIRDDDIGASSRLPSLKWISNLTISKNFKITYSIIPTTLAENPETIYYLLNLDQNYFEFATHGYEHILFKGLPYEEQYSLIENGTKIIEETLNLKPYTFVPPYGSSDTNTTLVLKELGYHSITDMRDLPSYIIDFISDFNYETKWDPKIEHCDFEEFVNSFDLFYNSTDEYFIMVLHDWTFLDETNKINDSLTIVFEQVIDYIKKASVQFMTIEEAYRRQFDENTIKTGSIDENTYFIDLKNCTYDHVIKVTPPPGWDNEIYLKDNTTGITIILDKKHYEFDGIKDHTYQISNIL
jgi:peptidoglycan/xylan/chitin deacetylase (PgdA/CDA1 family)